ncbi:MAG TPA: glycosyltransferase family 4 protein [Jatrophihabitans sp.]
MSRVAVITPDVLRAQMAGPAIRAFQISAELSAAGHDVRLISTVECSLSDPRFDCRAATWGTLKDAVGDAEVVLLQGYVTYRAPWLLNDDRMVVVDLYDPLHLEQLEQLEDRDPLERQAMLDLTVRILNEQLLRGDFFLCASEEQRHLWLGHLGALGRLNPQTYAADPTLRSLIGICPFGLQNEPPVRTKPAIRGVVPGIGSEEKVVLWAGGVYNWFDPLTLLRAIAKLVPAHPDLRLFFLGMKHPNPEVPQMRVAWQAKQLADELGLTGSHVIFNDTWVAYDERQNYLLDADLGVSTHYDHLETTFSFRTRILDYLWAGLPIVTTVGDAFGRLVTDDRLGLAVPEQDVDALATALETMLYDEDEAASARRNVTAIASDFTWNIALAPLVEFCAKPLRAADAGADRSRLTRRMVMPKPMLVRLTVRAWLLLRQGGVRVFTRRLLNHLSHED